MANLDKLLKQIEKNKETENEVTTHKLTIAGETFDVETMSKKEKDSFLYAMADCGDMSTEKKFKKLKPYIYRSFPELAKLAVKAKDAGLITANYDIVDEIFNPLHFTIILDHLFTINNIVTDEIQKEIDKIKKP